MWCQLLPHVKQKEISSTNYFLYHPNNFFLSRCGAIFPRPENKYGDNLTKLRIRRMKGLKILQMIIYNTVGRVIKQIYRTKNL